MKKVCGQEVLEKIFLQVEQDGQGTNNVWAENDGVMSMRIGKNFQKN